MDTIKLQRTGQAPLEFTGEVIARNGGQIENGQEQNRYYDISVYRTGGGNYVIAVEYCTCWRGESNYHFAASTDVPQNIEIILREAEADCGLAFVGYPPGEAYAEKQGRLKLSLRQRFEQQMSDVLSEIDGAAEKID